MATKHWPYLNLIDHGVFAINKKKNITSAEVCQLVKSLLLKDVPEEYRPTVLKVGHGGTLDHVATGVLAVGVGDGCKILPKLLRGKKKYRVTGCLGSATDTYNDIGVITEEAPYCHITRESLENSLKSFKGCIMQVPPKYSALKCGGQRIADLTRKGIDIPMVARPVKCYNVMCTHFSPPFFQLEVTCGGGFYIRSLIHDLGKSLQSCAHVTELERTRQDPFSLNDCVNQDELTLKQILNAIQLTNFKYSFLLKKLKTKSQK